MIRRALFLFVLALAIPAAARAQCVPNTGIEDGKGATNGQVATGALLNAATGGMPGNWTWTVSTGQSTNQPIIFETAAHGIIAFNHPFCSPLAFYLDTSTTALSYQTSNGPLAWVQFNYPTNQGTLTQSVVGYWFSTNVTNAACVALGGQQCNVDLTTSFGSAGGYNNIIFRNASGILGFTCETVPAPVNPCSTFVEDGSGNPINTIPVSSNFTRVWITLNFYRPAGAGLYQGRVYAESTTIPGTVGALIGQWDLLPGTGASPPLYTTFGNIISNVLPTGQEWRYDHLVKCFSTAQSCTYPMLPDPINPPWSAVLDPARAANWPLSGIPPGNGPLPSLAWTQCGATVTAGTYTGAALTTTLAACAANTFLFFGPGTFNVTGQVKFPTSGNRAIRGSGANSTFVVVTGAGTACGQFAATFCIKSSDGSFTNQPPPNLCDWIAGYAQGATALTFTNNSGTCLSAISTSTPTLIFLDQADTGYTGNPPTGCAVDNNALYVAGDIYASSGCASPNGASLDGPDAGGSRAERDQIEIHTATNVNGNTVTVSPPIIAANFANGLTPQAYIVQPIVNSGLENLSIDLSGSGSATSCAEVYSAWTWWVTGVRCISAQKVGINLFQVSNGVAKDNYVFGVTGTPPTIYGIRWSATGNNIIQNNIVQKTLSPLFVDGASTADVAGYNFAINALVPGGNSGMSAACTPHAGDYYSLWEGNYCNQITPDDIHACSAFITMYRNFIPGWESDPVTPKTALTQSVADYFCARYHNHIANVLGTPPYHTIYTSALANKTIYQMGTGGGAVPIPTDNLVKSTAIFYATYDTVTALNRFCGNASNTGFATTCANTSEIPTGATAYPNPVPAKGDTVAGQPNLPASFYLGTTAPSWWPPAIPFPAIGNTVSGGNVGLCAGAINTAAQMNGVPVTASGQCPGSSKTPGWNNQVNAIPAMQCYLLNMNGPADGTGNALLFDPTACYPGTIPQNPAPSRQGMFAEGFRERITAHAGGKYE